MTPKRRRTPAKRDAGSAVVELLVLLPVLLLVILAMAYLGQLTIYKGRTHFGGEYAMNTPGDQSEDGAVRGEVSDQFYAGRTGELTVVETLPQPAEFPEPGELRDMFEEMSQVTYSTYATGRYVFSGGQLQFVVQTHQSRSLSSDGQYVAGHRLLEDDIPELATELVEDWQVKNRVEMNYSYRPGYISLGAWPLDAVDLSTAFQSVIRTEKTREVTSPGAGMKHQIDAVTGSNSMRSHGRLPSYPDFGGDQAFWEPN